MRRCPTDLGLGAFQKLDYDVKDVNRLQHGVEAERTALEVLHVISQGWILGRGHAAEGVRLGRLSDQEERGDKCHFAAKDEGGKAIAQVVEGEVFGCLQITRGAEEREYRDLEKVK